MQVSASLCFYDAFAFEHQAGGREKLLSELVKNTETHQMERKRRKRRGGERTVK